MTQTVAIQLAVLIPYHNEGPLLNDCLESLRSDRLPEEILVYDDASAIPPKPYIPPDLPVRVIRGDENRGPAYGRNALLEACRSEYLHFHDADDVFADGWLREVSARFATQPIDAVFTEVATWRDGELLQPRVIGLEALARDRDLVRFCIRGSILPGAGTYRRDRVRAIGGYSTDYWQSEDYDFHIRLAASGIRFDVISTPLVRMRIRPDSRSNDQNRVWVDAVRALQRLAGELGPEYADDICEGMVRAGRRLYEIGALEEAAQAFVAAHRIGRPKFRNQSAFYRFVASCCGPMMAERAGKIYRSVLPGALRQMLRS